MSFEFDPTVSALETKYNIPTGLYKDLLMKGERSGQNAVSPNGAIGFAQLMPGTAKDMGVDPWDPEQNLEGGAKYFRAMLDQFKTPELALAAYNAGPGNVRKAGGIPNFPETQAYVRRVLGMSVAPDGRAIPPTPDVGSVAGRLASVDQGLLKQAQTGLAHSQEVTDDVEKQLQESRARMQAIQDEPLPARPKPPTIMGLPDAPEKDDYIKDPMRVLGQTLPMIAVLGGLGARNGAVNAMRSAAAAMNAARANDKDAFQQARQEWKDNMEKVISTNDQETKRYMAILEDRKMSAQDKIAELQVQTALDGNSHAQSLVANGQLDQLYKLIQMNDASTYRAAQVFDLSERRSIDRDRLGLEQKKLDALTNYRAAQIDLAKARTSKTSLSQFIGQQMSQKAANIDAWTPEMQQVLEEAQSTYQRTNWGADGSAPASPAPGAPVVAPGAEVRSDGVVGLPLPKTEAELKNGVVYNTARGLAKWDAETKQLKPL